MIMWFDKIVGVKTHFIYDLVEGNSAPASKIRLAAARIEAEGYKDVTFVEYWKSGSTLWRHPDEFLIVVEEDGTIHTTGKRYTEQANIVEKK